MSNEQTPLAWLERPDGDWVQPEGDCPIGRMPDNKVVLLDDKVSRYHALIQHREHDEYWLIDLGSSNGTYHNQRRIRAPMLLRDRDQVQVGEHGLVFHQVVAVAEEGKLESTLLDVKSVHTWLLIADIEGSSRLQQTLPVAEARKTIHAWMSWTRSIVEKNRGVVNQFLGDGVFAYWLGQGSVHAEVARALADLAAARRSSVITGGTVPVGRYVVPGFTAESLFCAYAGDAGASPEHG